MKKILIVEDNELNMKLFYDILQFQKYEPIKAMDGLEGYEKIKNNKFDLVVLDIQLPKMTGFQILEKLKEENILVNVVSMPSWYLFDKQSKKYQKSILCNRYQNTITLEMLSTMGWSKYGKYNIGLDTFGKSAKASDVIKDMGFDFESVYTKIRNITK